jgi:hypothetical protein
MIDPERGNITKSHTAAEIASLTTRSSTNARGARKNWLADSAVGGGKPMQDLTHQHNVDDLTHDHIFDQDSKAAERGGLAAGALPFPFFVGGA